MKALEDFSKTLLMLLLCLPAGQLAANDNTQLDASAWLSEYGAAWEQRDAARAASLFTEDATYQDNPFNEPYQGRESIAGYWSEVTEDQRDVSFDYELLRAYGQTAIAHWSARFTAASTGATINLEGIFLLEFDPNGLCKSLKEWWNMKIDEPEKDGGS